MTEASRQRLRRGDRLRDRRDFQRVAREGMRATSRSFIVLASPRRDPSSSLPRLGITASRRVGGAVVRTRIKRRIREWFRRRRMDIPQGVDIVVIARNPAALLDQRSAEIELQGAARRLRAPAQGAA